MGISKDELVIAIGDVLADECKKELRSTWNNDVRLAFARAVISKLDELGCRENDILGLINGDVTTCDGYCQED
jgi:hypothetical protein